MRRPVLYVLAGVNGAGKSSIGGHLLQAQGVRWFNPDTFARELRAELHCPQEDANSQAWQEGMRRLDIALRAGTSFAFETTLAGRTVPARILDAAATHDVFVWFAGLDRPERHIARVALRVAAGGHDIPEATIRERYPAALANLIALMPAITHLQVYDNSHDVARGKPIPDPVLVLEVSQGTVTFPKTKAALARTPEWAKPLVEAALEMGERPSGPSASPKRTKRGGR
jgi:predicted ABC-type ATPase